MNDRRGLTLGIVLLALGGWFLLRQRMDLSGPGPILLLIGAILFAISATRGFRSPLLGGCVLLGLGSGFLLRESSVTWLTDSGAILFGLGCGFLLMAAIGATLRRRRGYTPLLAGVVLVAIALSSTLSRYLDRAGLRDLLDNTWPWLLIAAGIVLVVTSLKRQKSPNLD
jgi:FtsH-binding integral membrane protein